MGRRGDLDYGNTGALRYSAAFMIVSFIIVDSSSILCILLDDLYH